MLPWLYGICTNILRRHRRDEVRLLKAFANLRVSNVEPPSPELVDVARALASLVDAPPAPRAGGQLR